MRQFVEQAKGHRQTVVVAEAADSTVLAACCRAYQEGVVEQVILTGDCGAIREAAEQADLHIGDFAIKDAADSKHAAKVAVDTIRNNEASILVKGLLQTADLLRAVLNKTEGLRTGSLLSHIGVLELPHERIVLVTDGGVNIKPTLEDKVKITNNAVGFAQRLGIASPKVALLAAVENVNPRMPETLEAAILTQMNRRGQCAKGAVVDGPLAIDNAISAEAAHHKGISGPVAGEADVLVVPDIVAGNILYKLLAFAADVPNAGLIAGARCPIVLTSRADTMQSKLNSLAAAVCVAAG